MVAPPNPGFNRHGMTFASRIILPSDSAAGRNGLVAWRQIGWVTSSAVTTRSPRSGIRKS